MGERRDVLTLAHELGHFSHRHVQKRMAGIFGFSLLALALLGWLAAQSSFFVGLGVTPQLGAPNDALALLRRECNVGA